MEQRFIVAEVTKNWTSLSKKENLLSQQFEQVINVNLARGYKLVDWKFSQTDNGSVFCETIIAIFEATDYSKQT